MSVTLSKITGAVEPEERKSKGRIWLARDSQALQGAIQFFKSGGWELQVWTAESETGYSFIPFTRAGMDRWTIECSFPLSDADRRKVIDFGMLS